MGKFSHIVKISVFALSIGIFGLAPAAQAMSSHKNNNRHSYANNYNKHNYKRHNYKRHSYKRHNYGYKNYRYNNYYSYNNYGYNNRHNRHNNRGSAVALGVLTGGLLFYALTANQRKSNYDRTVYVQQQQPTYAQPVQQPVQAQNQTTDSSCLQVREYQTTITVGGQSVPAYGQSCLQPDGSWKLGPAIPEPGY